MAVDIRRQLLLGLRNGLDFWSKRYQSYTRVNAEEGSDEKPASNKGSAGAFLSRTYQQAKKRVLLSATAVVVLVIIVSSTGFRSHRTPVSPSSQQDHLLFLLLPSSHPTQEVCRSVLTAGILGYPTPYLINWDRELDNATRRSEQQRTQIKLTFDYLSHWQHEHTNAMVILLDGPHAWFQLRPETLLSRYYEINARANQRLETWLAEDEAQQTVVVSAQDHCSRNKSEHIGCFAVPTPPHSEKADRDLRHPNVGAIVGPLGDIQKVFERMSKKAHKAKEVDMQLILEEIFGEQEYRREVVRQSHWYGWHKTWHKFQKSFGFGVDILDADPNHPLRDYRGDANVELGIGVDYGNELGMSVEDDGKELQWSRNKLPHDIEQSMPPFWTTTGQDVPSTQWKDVSLISSSRTKSIPVFVKFKSLADNQISLLQEQWKKLWMHPHAKALWDDQQEVPRLPIGSVVESGKIEHTFWNQDLGFYRESARTINGAWVHLTDICNPDEIF